MNNQNILLKKLLDGNKRYLNNIYSNINKNQKTRDLLYDKQKPFATIITCSDSRVPPEIIFDLGLGEIFTIRVAGHILSETDLGTIEYAIEYLKTKLIVVMGHTNCGIIKNALDYHNNKSHYNKTFRKRQNYGNYSLIANS